MVMIKLTWRWRKVRGVFENERFLLLVHYRFFFKNQLLYFVVLFCLLFICVTDLCYMETPKIHHFFKNMLSLNKVIWGRRWNCLTTLHSNTDLKFGRLDSNNLKCKQPSFFRTPPYIFIIGSGSGLDDLVDCHPYQTLFFIWLINYMNFQ